MNKALIFVLLLALVAFGGFVLFGKESTAPDQGFTPPNELAPEDPSNPTTDLFPKTETIVYTDAGFTPNNITILTGDTVTFTNNSTSDMWVGSNPHPQHTDYSAFDAMKNYTPGESYSFTFTESGTYGYHNHSNAGDKGTIVVTDGK